MHCLILQYALLVSFCGYAEVMFESWVDRCDDSMLAMMKGNGDRLSKIQQSSLHIKLYFLQLGNNICT